jgi:hypothetical protein
VIAGNDTTVENNIFVFIGKDDLKPGIDANAFDFHLRYGSPAVDAGSDTVTANGQLLTPQFQYVHPACAEGRSSVGKIDIGAYERGGRTAATPPDAPSRCSIEPAAEE